MSEEHGNRTFLMVWGWLLGLTIVEVVLAYMDLGLTFMLVTLLGLSFVKTGLIVAYFMHMKYEKFSFFLTLIPATVVCILLLFAFFPDSLRLLELRP